MNHSTRRYHVSAYLSCLNLTLFFEGEKHVYVQALIPQPTVEALNISVLHRLAQPNEIQLNAGMIRPRVHCPTGELASSVHGDRQRNSTSAGGSLPSFAASSAPSAPPRCRSERSASRSPAILPASAERLTGNIRIAPGSRPVRAIASAALLAGRDDSDNATKIAEWEPAPTLGARSPGRRLAPNAPTRAGAEALEPFSDNLLQQVPVQRKIGHQLLQLRVLLA